jgi:exodeoxyribonuclease V beta subunit
VAALHGAAGPRGPVTLDDRPAESPVQDEQSQDEQPDQAAPISGGIDQAVNALPGGTEAGILLHGILQRIDFAAVALAKQPDDLLLGVTGKLIEEEVERYRNRLPTWRANLLGDGVAARQAVAAMVFAVLRVPLAGVGRLCDLAPGDLLREMEFFLHVGSMSRSLPKLEAIEATADGFLTGQIDLLVRRGNVCYFIDYKSNLLPGGYDERTVSGEIVLHRYDLQRAIYAAAVTKWLAERGNLALAGAVYLFVRGIEPGDLATQSASIVYHAYANTGQVMHEFDELVSGRLAEQLVGR